MSEQLQNLFKDNKTTEKSSKLVGRLQHITTYKKASKHPCQVTPLQVFPSKIFMHFQKDSEMAAFIG